MLGIHNVFQDGPKGRCLLPCWIISTRLCSAKMILEVAKIIDKWLSHPNHSDVHLFSPLLNFSIQTMCKNVHSKLFTLIEFPISRTFGLPGKREISRKKWLSREISREKVTPRNNPNLIYIGSWIVKFANLS